jgi:hypothetical protein
MERPGWKLMLSRSRGLWLPIAIAAALAQAATAAPQTLDYGVDVGVAETDNVTLVPTDKVSQTMALVSADFDVKQLTRLLDLDAKGNFSYIDYLQDAYGRQLLGRFDGMAKIALVPQLLTWVVQDDFGQSALDPFTPTIPSNLENVNYFSTGPDLALRLGATTFMDMSARVARAQYETSPYNSDRLLGNLAWGLQLSAQSSVSLNADTERVLFENTIVNTDFDRTNGFVRYEIKGARTDLSADLGATVIDQDGSKTNGGLVKFDVSHKLSAAAKLTLSVGRDLTDASNSFSSLQSGAIGIVGTAPAAQTSDSYTSDYVTAGWQYERNRTIIAVSGHYEKDSYGQAPVLDYSRGGAEFRVERKLTRALNLEVLGRLYKTDYANPAAIAALSALNTQNGVVPPNGSSDFSDSLVGAALTWVHGRALEVRLRVEHSSRVTTGVDAGYRENRVLLTVGYRPRPLVPNPDLEAPEPASAPGT